MCSTKYAFGLCFVIVILIRTANMVEEKSSIKHKKIKNHTSSESVSPNPPLPPVIAEVLHGKANTVTHDLVGSIGELPIIVTEVIKPKMQLVEQTIAQGFNNNEEIPQETIQDLVGNETSTNISTNAPLDIVQVSPLKEELDLKFEDQLEKPKLKENWTDDVEKTEEAVSVNASHDDIPSFSEWAKKQMAEVEKKGENLTVGISKPRSKNYASPDCGAKVVGHNPEAVSPSAILSPSRDDYMLNPCTVKIWFIVELCEVIQPQRIEMANFELFSSSPQELSIWVSDRFPTRDWIQIALVEAKDEKSVQSFALPQTHFAKYVKVELHSRYGNEHYCPISLFKAYGTSELELLDNVDNDDGDEHQKIESEEEIPLSDLDIDEKDNRLTDEHNIFGSAKAAVLSIVKKAAEVLVKGSKSNDTCANITLSTDCLLPGYQVVCSNCSESFFYKLLETMCCQSGNLRALLMNSFVHKTLTETTLCNKYGFNWIPSSNISSENTLRARYIELFLPEETIAALCNYISDSKEDTSLKPNTTQPPPIVPEQDHTESHVNFILKNPDPTLIISPTKTLAEDNFTIIPLVELISESNATNITNVNIEEENISNNITNENTTDVQPAPSQEDPPIDLSIDSLFPELDDESTAKSTLNQKQKESVFVRLANRIKALEINMSLSSQYLEELSRRYKKQVEELQRNVATMVEERRLASERENIQSSDIKNMKMKITELTSLLEELVEERSTLGYKLLAFGQLGIVVVLEISFVLVILGFCKWLFSSKKQDRNTLELVTVQRRHSMEESGVIINKQRRPSEEALIPSGATHEELLLEPVRKISKDIKRKKKRKRSDETIVSIGNGLDKVESIDKEFIHTAMWSRKHRNSTTQTSSSQETLFQPNQNGSGISKNKKTGAFKKMVKKLF